MCSTEQVSLTSWLCSLPDVSRFRATVLPSVKVQADDLYAGLRSDSVKTVGLCTVTFDLQSSLYDSDLVACGFEPVCTDRKIRKAKRGFKCWSSSC